MTDNIVIGECNFCRIVKEVQYFNFQAICYDCTLDIFVPIIKNFESRRKPDAA
jgi:hypothetical protein